MFRIEFDKDAAQHALVAADGEKLPLRDDVWQRLRDPTEIFSEWKKFLQKWSIHTGKVDLLKRECPDDGHYRSLRTVIRAYQPEQQA